MHFFIITSAVLKDIEGPRPPKILDDDPRRTQEHQGGSENRRRWERPEEHRGPTERPRKPKSDKALIFMKKPKYKSVKQLTITIDLTVYASAVAWATMKDQKISAYIEWALKMQEAYNKKHYKAGQIWITDLGRWMSLREYTAYMASIMEIGRDKK